MTSDVVERRSYKRRYQFYWVSIRKIIVYPKINRRTFLFLNKQRMWLSFLYKLLASTKKIQIETKPQIVRYKEEDLVVVCTLNKPETLQNLFFIQLKRRAPSGTLNNVVSVVTGDTIQWQDQTLQNRANVTGTVASPATAHLSMVIRKDSVQCPLDFTEYECSLSGFGAGSVGAVSETTNPVKVSYTGRHRWFIASLKLPFFFYHS